MNRVYMDGSLRSLLFILSFLIIATIVVSARARFASPAEAQPTAPGIAALAAVAVAPQGNSDRQRVETELITITTIGFEPSEITHPQGSFFLEVDNRSQLPEVDLQLDSEHGERVHQKRVPREQLDWYQPLELHPGRYVLTEANHPDWVCHITITAR